MASEPRRVQLRRTKGWRMPENTVKVARPTKWGNPFVVGQTLVRMPALDGSAWEREGRLHKATGEQHAYVHPDGTTTRHRVELATAQQCVDLYRDKWIPLADLATLRAELAGKNLACFCPLDQPCHADVLLELANEGGGE